MHTYTLIHVGAPPRGGVSVEHARAHTLHGAMARHIDRRLTVAEVVAWKARKR